MYRPDSEQLAQPVARLHYPCGQAPGPGRAYEIAPGIDRFEQSLWRNLARLRDALREPRRVVDLFAVLFAVPVTGDDALQYALATGEALAHLNYLHARGELDVRIDGAGVAWYCARQSGPAA